MASLETAETASQNRAAYRSQSPYALLINGKPVATKPRSTVSGAMLG